MLDKGRASAPKCSTVLQGINMPMNIRALAGPCVGVLASIILLSTHYLLKDESNKDYMVLT